MRHDPASAAIVIMLGRLKMFGPDLKRGLRPSPNWRNRHRQLSTYEEGRANNLGDRLPDDCVPILSRLQKAEPTEREVRSIACHIKSARFPACKDLSGFDFAATGGQRDQ
jgi:hypothetical protein